MNQGATSNGEVSGDAIQRRRYHADGTLPTDGAVFVFGSNTSGRHGKGAAEVARLRFGAVRGVGAGRTGHSFAIPTKTEASRPRFHGELETIPLEAIERHIRDFVAHAKASPGTAFFVTRIGCALAGYVDADIAPLFIDAPENCSFASDWKRFLEPSIAPTQRLKP